MDASTDKETSAGWGERLTLTWAYGGMLLLLIEPAWRLGQHGVMGYLQSTTPGRHWGYLVAMVTMLYVEGYRGFHRSFAPKFAQRARTLSREGSLLSRVLAPFAAMGLCACDRQTKVRMWSLTIVIVGCVFAVRASPEPVRSMIDAGVSLALLFGATTLVWHLRVEREAPAERSVALEPVTWALPGEAEASVGGGV